MAPTPLARFVRERLAELEIKQSDFCRLSMFDQGLLSKIQNSVVTSLSLESVLKLAVGLSVPPHRIFSLLDRMDMHELVMKSYAGEFSDWLAEELAGEAPDVADRLRESLKSAADKPLVDRSRASRRRFGSNGEQDASTILFRREGMER
jgi:transcriptional regulator with XRE-family HTH domain